MFIVYHSNQIANHKDLLAEILQRDPNPDPFAQETVLVQSLGMAQWLQMELAEKIGVTGNIQFPYPTSFLWQQYRVLFPELPKENIFERNAMVWRLMRLLPECLNQPSFEPLANYLKQPDQLKLYQLACKIADLFDQYLVYRPHWLVYWENNQLDLVLAEIKNAISFKNKEFNDIQQNQIWQSELWKKLVADLKQETTEEIFTTSHRAYLQQRYFEKLANLTEEEKEKLPKRIFIFGISSLPQTQLSVLKALSEYCHIHLFFTNPSEIYWGSDREEKALEKVALKQQLSIEELEELLTEQGNPLLTTWGKQGKEFLNLLVEQEPHEINFYLEYPESYLLSQVKNAILTNQPQSQFELAAQDKSIQIHACHSKMREIEVLHNQLLDLFEKDPDLSPKDIIVMSADIDSYAPYINAVFANYDRQDPRFIPFTLSDQKISYIDPTIESFLTLLSLKEQEFSAEAILDLFNVNAIREKAQLSEQDLIHLRDWIQSVGIRSGLTKENPEWVNYNSWQNGLERLLLGASLKTENNPWQDILAFDQSYGLAAELVGKLAKFIDHLRALTAFIQQPQTLSAWREKLSDLIRSFYDDTTENADALFTLNQAIENIIEQIQQTQFNQKVDIDVLAQIFIQQLSDQRSNLNFLVGKVNFCTLLPMRAIPFKVVCLLGMNESDFPRQQTLNNFDLMQYAPQKGDRARRDDDRYLFLEALLSAQQVFYVSYIGQSLTENSEKLPSILVSQLLDYLAQNLDNRYPIHYHPMTIFSQNNLLDEHISYDKEWINAKSQKHIAETFIQKVESELENSIQIELNDVIAYLQSPVKWYFNRLLGVRFDEQNELIEDAEPFQLSGLEKYYLLDELLNVDLNQNSQFFENAKLQGNLPACHFAEISQNELNRSIKLLQETLIDYLAQESEVIEINQSFNITGKTLQLVGNIPNKFGEKIIQWRVGDLKDKYMIQSWVIYLLLKANHRSEAFRFYYRQGDEAKYLTFNEISAEDAKNLLITYLTDYLSSFNQLKWAVTDKLNEYIAKTSSPEQCQIKVAELEDIYIQRILAQNHQLDYDEIHQRTLNWFAPMIHHINQ